MVKIRFSFTFSVLFSPLSSFTWWHLPILLSASCLFSFITFFYSLCVEKLLACTWVSISLLSPPPDSTWLPSLQHKRATQIHMESLRVFFSWLWFSLFAPLSFLFLHFTLSVLSFLFPLLFQPDNCFQKYSLLLIHSGYWQ